MAQILKFPVPKRAFKKHQCDFDIYSNGDDRFLLPNNRKSMDWCKITLLDDYRFAGGYKVPVDCFERLLRMIDEADMTVQINGYKGIAKNE